MCQLQKPGALETLIRVVVQSCLLRTRSHGSGRGADAGFQVPSFSRENELVGVGERDLEDTWRMLDFKLIMATIGDKPWSVTGTPMRSSSSGWISTEPPSTKR